MTEEAVNGSVQTNDTQTASSASNKEKEKRRTGQKGTQKTSLDSLGAELRATLGIFEEGNSVQVIDGIDESFEENFSAMSNKMYEMNMDSWQHQVKEIMEKGNRDNFEEQNNQRGIEGKQRWPTGENPLQQFQGISIEPQGDRPELFTNPSFPFPFTTSSSGTAGDKQGKPLVVNQTLLNKDQMLQAAIYLMKVRIHVILSHVSNFISNYKIIY